MKDQTFIRKTSHKQLYLQYAVQVAGTLEHAVYMRHVVPEIGICCLDKYHHIRGTCAV